MGDVDGVNAQDGPHVSPRHAVTALAKKDEPDLTVFPGP